MTKVMTDRETDKPHTHLSTIGFDTFSKFNVLFSHNKISRLKQFVRDKPKKKNERFVMKSYITVYFSVEKD